MIVFAAIAIPDVPLRETLVLTDRHDVSSWGEYASLILES